MECHNTLRTDGVARPIVRGMAHDVTDRVRAEKTLRANNEQLRKTASEQERTLHELTLFRALLDQSNDAIKVIDPETLRFIDVNEKSCEDLGYSRDELLSLTVYDVDPNANESLLSRMRQQWRDSGFAIIETMLRRKDGTTFPVDVNTRFVRLDREYVVAVSHDITERKLAEKASREIHEKLLRTAREQELTLHGLTLFRTLLDQSNDALLVEYFVQKCGRRMNRSITSIPKTTMDALMGWEWPGNVRELENFIERSVILTQGSALVTPLSELNPIAKNEKDESLEAAEREHILRALRESHGQIGGLRGAAMRLGLKRTTLQSKLKRFGINPRSVAKHV